MRDYFCDRSGHSREGTSVITALVAAPCHWIIALLSHSGPGFTHHYNIISSTWGFFFSGSKGKPWWDVSLVLESKIELSSRNRFQRGLAACPGSCHGWNRAAFFENSLRSCQNALHRREKVFWIKSIVPQWQTAKPWCLHPFPWLREHVWSWDQDGSKWGGCVIQTILCSLFSFSRPVPLFVSLILLPTHISTISLFCLRCLDCNSVSHLYQTSSSKNLEYQDVLLTRFNCNHSWKMELVSMGTQTSSVTVNQDVLAFVCPKVNGICVQLVKEI